MTGAAVRAFDAIAPEFDDRFGAWRSVAAQRRAVQRALLAAFPPGARLIELGAGTGEDAMVLARAGRTVLLTDGAPAMCRLANAKLAHAGLGDRATARPAALETFDHFAAGLGGDARFDGAYSNFAALNCALDLRPVARGLARLLRPGGRALLVLFGPCAPGEILVETLRGRPRNMFRRLRRGPVPARLGGEQFAVRYPAPGRVARELAPWFRLRRRQGVGVFVPPSAAEPWISRYPRLVAALERLDRLVSRPLALLGDHVLLDFTRTDAAA